MKGDLKKEVAKRMLFTEEDFSKTELEIIEICEDILLSRLEDLRELEQQIFKLSEELKNREAELKEMRLEFIRKRLPQEREWD